MTNANRPAAQDCHPDILSVHAQRQRKVFFALCAVGFCILVGFSIVSYIGSNVSATWTHIVMVSIVAGAALALLLGIENLKVYRFACWGIGIGLYCLAALGSSLLYYHLVLPLLMFFCLGRREGTLGAGVFFFGMAVLMLAPGLVVGHVYPIGSTLRFLIGYFFVALVGWNYEKSREQFYGLLTTKNEQLQSEKEQLKDALSQVAETGVRLEQTNTELRNQTQLMETVFNSISDGVVVTDTDGNFRFVNPSAERIVGVGATDTPSDQWAETYGTFYPDSMTPFPSHDLPLVRAMRGETVDDVELFIRNQEKPKGVYISVNARPLQDDSGPVKGGVIVLRDISKLKETETELKQTVHRLQEQTHLMETVFNSMDEGIIVGDPSGRQILRNPSADRISGTRTMKAGPSEWAKVYGIFYPDKETYLSVDENPLVRAMRGMSTDNLEAFVRNENKPNGVYVSVIGRPIRSNETNEVTAGVIVFRDITKAKETEAQLKQTIAELRSQTHTMEIIFNSISDGVVVADESGKFTIFNPSAERIIGIGMTDGGPDQWSDQYGMFFPDRGTPFPTEGIPLVRAIRGESSDETEMFIRNPRIPEGVYISVSGRPLKDDSGLAKGGVIVFRDVTERMRAEEALTQAFAQGKLEIVDTILHNIGNAINSVTIGVGTIHEQLAKDELVHRLSALAKAIEAHRDDWIPYLQTDPQGQKVMPFILALAKDFVAQNAQLRQTVDRVENRVAHIVDIIRTQRSLDTGTMARKDVNLRKAITDAVKMLQDSLLKRGVQMHLDCQNAPQEIRIQESQFHQMLVNLIKNAIEAIDDLAKSRGLEAKQPWIQIRSYVQEDFLVLDVIDNGIGIEEKRFKIIFTAGYTTKKTGSGLGLHSTANFVIGSGGQIYPLSDGAGKGTTMRVKLRLASLALKSEAAGEGGTLP